MKIVDYGFFHVIEPPPGKHILLFENEKGEDWYDVRAKLTEWEEKTGVFVSAIFPTWAMVDADGWITNIEYDPSRLMPGDRRIIGIELPLEQVKLGMRYLDGKLVELPEGEEAPSHIAVFMGATDG